MFNTIISPTLKKVKRFQKGKFDVFSEILNHTTELGLIGKGLLFLGKMLEKFALFGS